MSAAWRDVPPDSGVLVMKRSCAAGREFPISDVEALRKSRLVLEGSFGKRRRGYWNLEGEGSHGQVRAEGARLG